MLCPFAFMMHVHTERVGFGMGIGTTSEIVGELTGVEAT